MAGIIYRAPFTKLYKNLKKGGGGGGQQILT